jgi:hypothetical protein
MTEPENVFFKFSDCSSIGCQLVYGNDPTKAVNNPNQVYAIDYLMYNVTSPSAGYARFRETSNLMTCADLGTSTATSINSALTNPFFDMPICFFTASPISFVVSPQES